MRGFTRTRGRGLPTRFGNTAGLPGPHRKHGPFCAARKTITKLSKYVQFVIKFVDATNPIHILNLHGPHNRNWQG
jgi:hypothetical protein